MVSANRWRLRDRRSRGRGFAEPLLVRGRGFKYGGFGRVLQDSRSISELEVLQGELRSLNNILKVAKQKGRLHESLVEEMEQISGDAGDMVDNLIDKSDELGCFDKFVSIVTGRVIAECKLKNEIKQMAIKIRDIISKWEATHISDDSPINYSDHFPVGITSNVSVDVGFDVQVKIRSSLTEHSNKNEKNPLVISIVGVVGVGKTNLAKRIFNDSVISRHFPVRVWVPVPRLFSSVEVLWKIKIMKQVNGEFEAAEKDLTYESLTENLRGILNSNRCLIVLDDVRTKQVWNALKDAFSDESNLSKDKSGESSTSKENKGSGILITTPFKDVAEELASLTNCFELKLLSDEEGWDILKTKLHVPNGSELVGKEIVRECMGFQRLILGVVDLLSQRRNESDEHWSNMLKQLKQDQESMYDHLKEAVGNDLTLDFLRCLYYFALFPKDYSIPVRRLLILWVAEGFIRAQGNEEAPESLADKYLTKLIEYNMIGVVKWKSDGKVKTCRLHDGLRDFFVAKAKKFFFHHYREATISNSSSSKINSRRLVDHYDEQDIRFSNDGSSRADRSDFWTPYKNLVTFLSFDSREGNAPGEKIERILSKGISRGCFQRLRVLDLERVFRPKLPESIGKLICLRYLGLRWTYLDMLPRGIDNLLKLETLDLKHTCISELPLSLWKMRQLRHLYLNESYRSRFIPPRGRCLLTGLQTLWGAFIDDVASVVCLRQLSSLRKFGLAFHLESQDHQAELAGMILKQEKLKSLRLISLNESAQPSVLNFDTLSRLRILSDLYLFGKIDKGPSGKTIIESLPEKLTDLTLSQSKLDEDPMGKLGELKNLRKLRLLSNTYTEKVMTCSSGSFPKLEVLKLWKQEELSEFIVEEESLSELREFEIRSCKNLKVIPDGFKDLKNLRELKSSAMPEFKASVNQKQGEDWNNIKCAFEEINTDAEWKIDLNSCAEVEPIPCPFKDANQNKFQFHW